MEKTLRCARSRVSLSLTEILTENLRGAKSPSDIVALLRTIGFRNLLMAGIKKIDAKLLLINSFCCSLPPLEPMSERVFVFVRSEMFP